MALVSFRRCHRVILVAFHGIDYIKSPERCQILLSNGKPIWLFVVMQDDDQDTLQCLDEANEKWVSLWRKEAKEKMQQYIQSQKIVFEE